MDDPRWFYADDAAWAALGERLKQTACPHCRVVGTLNKHGMLVGFDDRSPQRRTMRARRLYCSNRGRRSGCGRTVSVWLAETIRRSSVITSTLGAFLRRAVVDGVAAAVRAAPGRRSGRSWQRIWTRFDRAQSRIRTALVTLSNRGPPTAWSPGSVRRPDLAHVLQHLATVFAVTADPLAAYQVATRSFVL